MLFALWAATAALACEDVGASASKARDAVLMMEYTDALRSLADAEAGMRCGGVVARHELGLYWLVEGARKGFTGEEDEARLAFAAAARVAPDLWVVDFGPELQKLYHRARAETSGRATLTIDDVPPGWVVAVDGRRVELPAELPAGLHVVQVGADADDIEFMELVRAAAGDDVALHTGITPPAPEPAVVPEAAEDRPASALSVHVGVGAEAAVGDELTRQTVTDGVAVEPALKAQLPLELGLRLDLGTAWARAAAGGAPSLSGGLLYASDAGIELARSSWLVHGAAGVRVDPVRAGLLIGLALPGRQALRLTFGVDLPAALAVEARVGANLVATRGIEPAGALAVTWTPRLTEWGDAR